MVDYNNLSKRKLIENIMTFYLKNEQTIDININKISKQKLIDIIIDNDIPIYNNNKLIDEIKETENYTKNLEIIYYNFIKYHNINYDIIFNIKNNNKLTSSDLKKIIEEYNLIIDIDILNDDTPTNKIIVNLYKVAKLSKKLLIDNITIFYFKNGHNIDNLNKISKEKLINIMINDNIPIISKKQLKNEKKEIDYYKTNLNIIYHNFMKYRNISYDIIDDIKNNSNLKSIDLKNIILKNNLICDNEYEIKKTNKLILDLCDAYTNYYNDNNDSDYNNDDNDMKTKKYLLKYKTLPDIINCLTHLVKND